MKNWRWWYSRIFESKWNSLETVDAIAFRQNYTIENASRYAKYLVNRSEGKFGKRDRKKLRLKIPFTESVAFAAIRQRAPSLSPSVKRRECSSKRVHSLPWLKEKRSSEGKGEIERNEIKTRNEILCKFIGREERGGGRGSTSDERRRGISDGVKI